MPVQLDRSALPLIRIAYVGEYSERDLQRFLGELDGVLKLPGRKAGLIDLTRATPSSAKERQAHGEYIKSREKQLEQQFAAAAIVTDSMLIRGAITAVFWIRPLPLPTEVVATVRQAEAWLDPFLDTIKAGSGGS